MKQWLTVWASLLRMRELGTLDSLMTVCIFPRRAIWLLQKEYKRHYAICFEWGSYIEASYWRKSDRQATLIFRASKAFGLAKMC